MFAIGIVPALVLFSGIFFLPHSPRWILAKGKYNQAWKILHKIHGCENKAQEEFELIKASLAEKIGGLKILFSKVFWPAILVAGGLAFLQQVTGVNTILYYAPTILKMAGFGSDTAAIAASIIVGLIFVSFTIIAILLIDKLGRRPLLLLGVGVMAIGLLALSGIFHTDIHSASLKFLAVASMLLFIIGFAISLGPIAWLMIAEVFPTKVRGIGSSLAATINWGSNWLVAQTFLLIVSAYQLSGAFLLYFVMSIITFLFIYFLVPETKGVSLEKIETNLYAGKPTRWLGKEN